MAVQGGLLASLIASHKLQILNSNNQVNSNFLILKLISKFLVGKLVAYSVLGGLLGLLGSVVAFSPKFYGVTQLIAGIYMLGVVGAILELHPLFRYFLFQTPRSAGKVIREQSKTGTAFILGLLTVFIPCGTTQAMMVSAVTTGQFGAGALLMAVFILGTMPVFVLLGLGFTTIGKLPKLAFTRLAAFGTAVIAISSLNAGLVLMGSQVYPSRILREAYCTVSFCNTSLGDPTNLVNVEINSQGYTVDNSVIRVGEQVTVKLKNTNGGGCQQAFSVPALNVSQVVPLGGNGEITFTAPDKPGLLAFSCSMGMYAGQFTVVN